MSCKCKNESGLCDGSCALEKQYKQVDAIQMRSEKSIEDRVEYLLGNFVKTVDLRINKLLALSEEKYREGYRHGFEDGKLVESNY